jgi:hypothetical protein
MRYSKLSRQKSLKSLHSMCRSGISFHYLRGYYPQSCSFFTKRIENENLNFFSYSIRWRNALSKSHKYQSEFSWNITINSHEKRESSIRNFNISFSSSNDESRQLSKNLAHYLALLTVTLCAQINCHPIARLASDKNQNQTQLYFFRRPGLRYAPQLSYGTSIYCPIGFRFGKECPFEYHATSMQCGVRVLYTVSDRFNFLKFFKHQEVERLLSTHEKFTMMVYFSNHNAMWQEFARVSNLSAQLTTNKI